MSGTQDEIFGASGLPSGKSDAAGLPGADNSSVEEKELTPSQKMDRLLRSSSPKSMKKEIEKLRKEAAKYRSSSREEMSMRLQLQAKAEEINQELASLKMSHQSLNLIRKLDKAGCIKSELVAKDIPSDCEDIDAFIETYKQENGFLFSTQKQSIGGTFKPSTSINLTPSQRIDKIIRSTLGR